MAKELRKMNINVDLAIDLSDAVYNLPQWEEGSISDSDNSFSISKEKIINSWKAPNWIKYIDSLSTAPRKKYLVEKIKSRIKLFKIIREYDFIETHFPFMIYSQFLGTPYVVYDTGWIRSLPFSKKFSHKLAMRGYKKSKAVIITNPDTFDVVDNLSYIKKEKIFFTPFAIDPDIYKSLNVDDLRSNFGSEEDVILFSPSRQSWIEKGNDKMLRAFAKFCKVFPNSKFILIEWGNDLDQSKMLVKSLGISDKVVWINSMNKFELVKFYNVSDIVLDQFILGSWGTATPEAMGCGKPVLMFYDKKNIIRAFGEEPPILNSFTENEIYSNLIRLTEDVEFRKKIGIESKKWVQKTHSPSVVAKKHLQIIEQTIKNF